MPGKSHDDSTLMWVRAVTRRAFILTALLVVAGPMAAVAGPHAITYAKKSEPLGTQITLGNQTFDLVRVPIRLFSGEKYALIIPATRYDSSYGSLDVSTRHASDDFVSNLVIDSYPAQVAVNDVRSYTVIDGRRMDPDIRPPQGFRVGSDAHLTVIIQLGSTLIEYSFSAAVSETSTLARGTDLLPYAEWAKYRDPVGLIRLCDDLIDYIRVLPL